MKKIEMRQKTILVVDDEPFIRNILKRSLEKRKYRVVTACDGEKALGMVKKEKPDLIILDNAMPKMGGLEVSWKLKKGEDVKYRNIPIIMLTIKSMLGEVEEGIAAGADYYLPKPFTLKRLYDKIEHFIGK